MEWISVKDRLPEKEIDVLVYNGVAFSVSALIYKYGNDGWHERGDGYDYGYVTHWMPLPKSPEGE